MADVPALAVLGAELVRFHHQLDPQRFEILAQRIEEGYARFLAARLSDPQAVVLAAESERAHDNVPGDLQTCTSSGLIVGYAYGQIEGPSWPDLLGVHGKFHDLMVQADCRELGIGAALVQRMIELLRARGVPKIVLMAAWANGNARGFFSKLGFRPTMVEMTM